MAYSPDKLNTWQTRLDSAQSLQSNRHKSWQESHSLFEGSWFKKFQWSLDPDATAVNYATAYLKTLVDSIYSRNPFIFVKPRHSRYTQFAYSLQRVLNYYWRELNMKRQMRRGTFHASLYGLSWLETGYTTSIGQLNIADDATTQEENRLFSKLLGTSKRPEQEGVLNEYIKSSSPFCLHRSAYRVLMAPGYYDIHDMPYLFIAEDISPEDIDNHPIYSKAIDTKSVKATRVINASANMISTPFKNRKLSAPEQGGLVLYRLWHVWDRRNMERGVMVEGGDISIGPFAWPYSHEGFSAVPIMFNDIAETDETANPYPQGDLEPMIPLLRELNQLRTAMVRHRKRSGTLILVPDTMPEEQVKAIKSGEDVSVVQVSSAFIDLIKPHSPPQLAPDVYRVNERILSDLDLVGGFSQTILGAGAPKDTLATEINTQTQGSGIRTSAKVDAIESASVEVARRMAANIWEFMPREKVRMLLGETQLTDSMWPQAPEDVDERREFIQNEIMVEIEAGSTQPPKDKTIEREQWLKAIDVINLIAPGQVKKSAMVERTLAKFDEPDINSIMMSAEEQHLPSIQKENELLAQDIPQVVTPDEPHELHLAEHGKLAQQGQATPALDDHINQHAAFYQEQSPQGGGQSDANANNRSPSSEIGRSGAPTETDLTGPISRSVKETGAEKGGIRSL